MGVDGVYLLALTAVRTILDKFIALALMVSFAAAYSAT